MIYKKGMLDKISDDDKSKRKKDAPYEITEDDKSNSMWISCPKLHYIDK